MIASHVVLSILVLAIILKNTWGKPIIEFVAKHSLQLGLSVALSAVIGSVFYSEIIGFEPCVLCWWQRVLIYPIAVIFIVALSKRLDNAFTYVVPLATLAAIVAFYHAYTNLGGTSILPCTEEGSLCSRLYVMEFGYITIPTMSLTIAVYILVIAWIKRIYENRNA